MAESLQNIQNLQRKVGQTWGQAFESVDKTSQSFHKLVDEFVNFVGDWKDFSDIRRDRLAEYIKNLEGVQLDWEKINRWVSINSNTLDHYVGSLSDIQSIFRSISSEIGGIQRQTADRVNIARQLARLASDSLAATQQEGGLSRNVIISLDKRKSKVQQLYDSELKQLGLLNEKGILDEGKVEEVFKYHSRRAEALQNQVNILKRAKAEGLSIDMTQLRNLESQVKYHTSIAEFTEKNNISAVRGLTEQLDRQKELWKIQREGLESKAGINAVGADRVNVVSKTLKRFGLGEAANELNVDYGEFITKRIVAQQNVDTAKDQNTLGQQSLEAAKKDWEAIQKWLPESIAELQEQLVRKTLEKNSAISELEYNKSLADRVVRNSKGQQIDRQTGRYATQDLIQKSEEAAAKVRPLEKEVKDLEKELEALSNLIAQNTTRLDSSRIEYEAAKEYATSTAQAEKDAIDAQNKVLENKFDLVSKVKDSIVKGYLQLGKWGGPLGAAVALAVAFYHHLLKFDEEAVKTKRVIGQWADASALANTKFVTGTEVLKTMRDLGEQFHINPVQVFSPKELSSVAQAQKLTGMTAEAAGNLAVQSKITGKNVNAYRDSIAAGANQANKLNHSAVNLSAVQNDVLTTSRAIALSYGNNSERLARAAGAAAALGTNLQGVENIAKNLMNFESSIEAEMQAQLLTGMQLNLAKAREYALNNDLEGVTREIGRQGVNAAKFSHMNYIQQENMARALGMSREEMAKMLIMQEINNGLSAKQVAAMTGMRRQDIEALSAQEKWQTMKQRFLESLVPLLEPVLQLTSDILRLLNPILGIISKITGWISRGFSKVIPENWVYLRGLIGLIAVGLPVAIARGVLHVGVLGKAFKGLATLGVKVGKSIAGWATGLVKAGKSAQVTESIFSRLRPVRDYQGRTVVQRARDIRRLNRAKEINPAGAAATSKASASMGSTISKLGKNIGKIATGAAAALIIAGAVFVLAKAAQEFAKIDHLGKALLGAGAALIGLVGIVALLGAIMSSGAGTVMVLAGAAAMLVMAGAVWVLGNALKQVTAVPGNELQAIAGGIRAIAGAVGELGAKLGNLEVRKLNALGRAFKRLKGADIQVVAPTQEVEAVATQVSRIQEEPRETIGNPRENIKAAVQEITIKQAQVQASAQQISVEQKAADLSKIEQKMDRLERAINSLPRILSNDELSRGLNLALN